MRYKKPGAGKSWLPTRLKFGVPTALGKIKILPGNAIMSRCVLIHMTPETADERAEQMAYRQTPLSKDSMRSELRRALQGGESGTYTKAPEGIPSRMEDVWQPMLAVANAAGEAWTNRAVEALVDLSAGMGAAGARSLPLSYGRRLRL